LHLFIRFLTYRADVHVVDTDASSALTYDCIPHCDCAVLGPTADHADEADVHNRWRGHQPAEDDTLFGAAYCSSVRRASKDRTTLSLVERQVERQAARDFRSEAGRDGLRESGLCASFCPR